MPHPSVTPNPLSESEIYMNILFNHRPFDDLEDAGITSGRFGLSFETRRFNEINFEYSGARPTTRHEIHMYQHGRVTISTDVLCIWDSAPCGHIDLPEGGTLESVLDTLNRYFNNDNFYSEVNDLWFEGTEDECIEHAENLNASYTFEY